MTSESAFGFKTTAGEVAAHFASRAEGRLFLVTGGYGGLGAETVKVLLGVGARCHVVGRSEESLKSFLEGVSEEHGDRVSGGICDLADLASVREFARGFLAQHESLDVLINNAGVMHTPQGSTPQGFETQWGVNCVGTFLLTKLLVPALERAEGGRVVFLSSLAHRIHGAARLNLEYYRSYTPESHYDGWKAYQQSKLANILMGKAFSSLHKVDAASLHPGVINTKLGRTQTLGSMLSFIFRNLTKMERTKSVPQGAATTVFVALTPELENGAYHADCAPKEAHECASHEEDWRDLYTYCEEVTMEYQKME